MKKISGLFLLAAICQLQAQAQTISKPDVHDIVHSLTDNLTDKYPFPELSAQYKTAILKNEAAGKYNNLSASQLAEKLTADLQQTHKDVHLHIVNDSAMYARLTTSQPEVRQHSEDDELASQRRNNYNFRAVELNPATSTAYIRIDGFLATQEAFEMAAAAMNLAAYSKYVVIDLRTNGGGSGEMGRFLASYFYPAGDEQFYLNGFYKERGRDVQEWTYSFVPGRRNPHAKVFLLQGRGTGSAAEGMTYALQQLHRATIVGDTSAGAGIAGTFLPLKDNLVVFLPFKMVVGPGTNVGWEGTGVIPDIATGQEDAYAVVQKMIFKDMAQNANTPAEKELAQWMMEDTVLNATATQATTSPSDLTGQYTNNVSITLENGTLQYHKAEPGKPVQTFTMRELKHDVFVVIDLNKSYGSNSSRVYVNRDENGKIKGFTRKVLINGNRVYIVPASYEPVH
jgi:plastocyanin